MSSISRDSSAPYREVPPRPELRNYVRCVWFERSRLDGRPYRDRVVPDGFVDVVWGSDLWVRGADTRVHSVEYGARAEFVGIRLRPGAAAALLGTAVADAADQRVPLAAFVGGATELAERLADSATREQARTVLEAALIARLRRADPPDIAIATVVSELERRVWRGGMRALGDHVGLSDRQLHRRCVRALGYGPKTLERIFRFRRFARLAVADPARSLAELAVLAGYFDQAHLSRECARLAGETPRRFVRRSRDAKAPRT